MCMDLCSMGVLYSSQSMAYNYSLLNVSVYVGIINICPRKICCLYLNSNTFCYFNILKAIFIISCTFFFYQ